MVATDILLNSFFGIRFISMFRFVKQPKPLFCRFRLLTVCAKLGLLQNSPNEK